MNPSKEMWDKKAEAFNRWNMPDKNNEYTKTMLTVFDGNLKDARVLDIGCGTGVWSLCIADEVKSITGVDLSDGMIKYANINKDKMGVRNAEFHVLDWADAVVGEGPLAEKYDIVMMHMTPAIRDIPDMQKAIDVCRGFCFYTSGFSHDFPLREALEKKAGREHCRGHREIFFDILQHVVNNGMKPYIAYDTMIYDQEIPYDSCIEENLLNFPELKREDVAEVIDPLTREGTVFSHSEMTHITAYWKVN